MGKSPKPLVLVIEESIDGPHFDKLRQQGFTLQVMDSNSDIDLYLGPRCWMMTPEVAENPKLLEAAIRQAREIKYGMENKKELKTKEGKPVKRGRKAGKAGGAVPGPASQGDAGTGEVRPARFHNQASIFDGHETVGG